MAKKSSRTREARQRRQKQRRKNKRVLALMGIVVAAVVAIAVVIVSNQPVDAFIPDELSARYDAIERSISPEGYPRLGDSQAPVTVEEYASFACPGCEAFHSDSFDAVLERVREGQVLFTYVPLQTGSVPNAPGASRAALCAGEQTMFWEMHDILFDWQTRYGNTAFSQNRLLAGVEQLGLISNAFTDCFNSAATSATLSAAQSENVSTTPTIRVNGVTMDQGATIPSTVAILQAIDDATPADWGLPVEAEAAEPAEVADAEADAAEEAAEPDPEPVEEPADEESEPAEVAEPEAAESSEEGEAVEADEADAPESSAEAEDTDEAETEGSGG
ncbi:MAG: thioredoxin domain-containing protein [Anaerolineae bacterium]|nr:thioredoxin domain-containing protein [Anaerolineae bacterium]